jgi:membrane protease YdiL (CAAX protease family)
MLLYPLIFGGGSILLILALNKYFLGQKRNIFNSGRGSILTDITAGLVLTFVCFLLFFLERSTLMQILPQGKPPSQEVLDLMTGLARNPLLLAVWLGPVVWIGVALFEELVRVFFLNCLWKMSDKRLWEYFSIWLVALFAGMMHNYQGAFGVVSVCIQGLIMAAYFYRFRRFWPLVISHALFDSVQIIMFVLQTA